MTDRILMRPMTITLELAEPETGVYVAQAVSDDGDHARVESAACDALATVTPTTDAAARS